MRTLALALIAGVLLATPAFSNDCVKGTDKVLQLKAWTAKESLSSPANIPATEARIRFQNVGNEPIQMVDGTVWFRDALGESIGGISIARDIHIDAGQTVEATESRIDLDRLARINPENVTATICVESVLYGNGTKKVFDGPKQIDEIDMLLGKP